MIRFSQLNFLLLIGLLSYLWIAMPLRAAEPNCHVERHQTDVDEKAWFPLFQQAEQCQRLEDYTTSIAILQQALTKTADPIHQAMSLGSLGYACFMSGETEQAAELLKQSLTVFAKATAKDSKAKALDASIAITLNNLGNVYATYSGQNQIDEALGYYQQSVDLATQAGNPLLAIKAKLNFVQTDLQNSSQLPALKQILLDVFASVQIIKSPQAKIEVLLRLGRLMRQTYLAQPAYAPALRLKAFEALVEARQLAHQHHDNWGKSQALGYLGQLYFDEGRYQEALQATRAAIFLADDDQFSHNAEILPYFWHWQIGKIYQAQGQNAQAILAYRQAINDLWSPSLRYELATIYRIYGSSFRQQVGSLFLEFIDLLLKQAYSPTEEQERVCQRPRPKKEDQSNIPKQEPLNLNAKEICLTEAQATLENLKAAELFDYFQAECVIEGQLDIATVSVRVKTAVLYPIIFADRLEILLHKPHQIVHVSILYPKSVLEREITTFFDAMARRFEIEEVKAYAKNLHDILIRPIQHELRDIETLVFVPDGKLRTIPIAALYDGSHYLVEKYAIAVVPGLTLKLPSEAQTQPTDPRMLLAGYSKEYQGAKVSFNPLKSVELELNKINKQFQKYGPSEILLDNEFTQRQFEHQLRLTPYSHIHIASHASFGADIKNTFLLVANKRLPLNEFDQLLLLNRTHDFPTHLMTLSACETAKGDERAALGLGGIAHRAGIHSAIASLWKAKDEFASLFMPIFYDELWKNSSKAKALQQAQQRILNLTNKDQQIYKEPHYWATFILIGN